MAEAAIRLLMTSISHFAPAGSAASPPEVIGRSRQSSLPQLRRSYSHSPTSTTSTPDTELQPWRYPERSKSEGGEQDEVRRKRRETTARRDIQADRVWREFWD